jgi:hypothetical protein
MFIFAIELQMVGVEKLQPLQLRHVVDTKKAAIAGYGHV